jgi:hypothetical protein
MQHYKLYIRIILGISLFFIIDYVAGWCLEEGLKRYYGLCQHSKILIVGHSHMMLGIQRDLLEEETHSKVSKYTRQGVGLQERHLMTRQFLESPFSDSLKVALLGVDCWSFQGEGLSKNVHTLFYPFMDNSEVDDYVSQHSDFMDYWLHKLIHLTRFSEEGLNCSVSGWMGWDKNRKNSALTKEAFEKRRINWERPITFNPSLINELETCIRDLNDKNVRVILVNTPTYRGINDAYPKDYQKIMNYYQKLAAENPMVDFWNFSPKYQDSLHYFFDPIHLNVYGQEAITKEIIHKLRDCNR